MHEIRVRLSHVFINRDFSIFMLGSFVSALAMWFRSVTVSWVGFELTGSAFIQDLVPLDRLREAVAISSIRFNLSRVLAPALAGGLLVVGGPALCLTVSVVGSLGITVSAAVIQTRNFVGLRHTSWRAAIGEGLDYSWREADVRLLLLVTGGFGLLALPHHAFLPAYIHLELGLGPEGFGTFLTAAGVGGMTGALIMRGKFTMSREYQTMAAFIIATGIGLLAMGLVPAPVPALVALYLVGLGSIGMFAISQSTIQLIVPQPLVGRVMSLYVAFSAGAMPLGSLLLGSVAEQWGSRTVMLIGGMSALLVSLPLQRRPSHSQRF